MKTESLEKLQQVSDLMDNRLQGQDFARAVDLACSDQQALAAWSSYHLVGDVLRGGVTAAGVAAPGLLARVHNALAQEASVIPVDRGAAVVLPAAMPSDGQQRRVAANDSRWRLLAGLASVAAVSAIVWGVAERSGDVGRGAQLAQTTPPAVLVSQIPATRPGAELAPQVMIRDPHLDALLAAHKQFGGNSALQMPAGFVRNATFEGPSR